MDWLQQNWIAILIVAIPISVDILNKITKHWSERRGLVRALAFAIEVLNVIALRVPQLRKPQSTNDGKQSQTLAKEVI